MTRHQEAAQQSQSACRAAEQGMQGLRDTTGMRANGMTAVFETVCRVDAGTQTLEAQPITDRPIGRQADSSG